MIGSSLRGDVLRVGVDEAGRGPLAGPVTAAAVVFRPGHSILEVADSKTLSEKKRVELERLIKKESLCWAVGWASPEEIDQVNILQASLLAMRRAIAGCGIVRGLVLVDGIHCPRSGHDEWAIVKGDSKVAEISAASILAKQARDAEMRRLDVLHPGYGFAVHMGYPTAQHREAMAALGVTNIHRKKFGPVRRLIEAGGA